MCTGNLCRSPLAQWLLGRELERRGVPARVTSAGLVRGGVPAAPEVVQVLAARHLDARMHRSRALTAPVLAGADLVLGMAREHVREAVLVDPDLFPRAFTLKELVRRGHEVGPRPRHESLAAWLGRAADGRRPADLLGDRAADDIEDPIGRRLAVFERVAAEIERLVTELVDLAWPRFPDSRSGSPGR